MLRIKVEIVPYGQEDGAHTIHTINVGNMGWGTGHKHLYHAWLDVDPRTKPRPEPHAKVEHVRGDGALKLVRLVLQALKKGSHGRT